MRPRRRPDGARRDSVEAAGKLYVANNGRSDREFRRIAVEFVIDLLARGYTPQQIVSQYDHLTLDDVQACLAYAAEVLQSEKVYALPR